MQKYKYIQLVVLRKTKNKTLTNYILSYIKGNGPCKYLKNVVHYNILHKLQVFQLSRYYVCIYGFRNDTYDKETMYNIHTDLINNTKNNKIFISIYERSILKHIKNYCINIYHTNNINYFILKKGIKETINLNKDEHVEYVYNENNIF